MKITVDAQALASALQRIASIPGRSALPILGSVLIAAEGSSLTLTAYNLTVGARMELKAHVTAQGTLALPAQALSGLVRHLKGNLSIEADNQAARLRWETGQAALPGANPDEFPIPPFVEPSFPIPAEAFRRALQRVQYAACENTTSAEDAILEAIQIRIAANTLRTLATDRTRVAIAREALPDLDGPPQEILFPASSLQALFRLAPDGETFEIGTSERSITVRIKDTLFHTSVLSGTYPDVVPLLPKDYPVQVAVEGNRLVEALDRAGSLYMATSDDEALRVEISPQKLCLSLTKTPFLEELPGEGVGSNALFLDPGRLLKAVKVLGTENRIEIGFSAGQGPVRIRVPGAPDEVAFLMPIYYEALAQSA